MRPELGWLAGRLLLGLDIAVLEADLVLLPPSCVGNGFLGLGRVLEAELPPAYVMPGAEFKSDLVIDAYQREPY